MPRYNSTERIGVNAVESIVLDFGWIFREQPIVDLGIDAHIELDGKLIALQIKTGASHFKEKSNSYVYFGKTAHLEYWISHSLPVLLVGHIPNKTTIWQIIEESTIIRTDKGWKVEIPKSNIFGEEKIEEISSFFDGTLAEQKLRKLSIDEPLMRHIKNGGKVSLELEDWVNKSLGRTPVQVYIYNSEGEETLVREWFQLYTGYDIRELVIALFPWSSPIIDRDFYDQHQDDYCDEEDWHESLRRAVDADNSIVYQTDPNDIYPYSETAGEIESYRLELKLNNIGESFLILSGYLNK